MTRTRSNAFSGGQTPFVGAKPNTTPVIGAHRNPAPKIGGHRTPLPDVGGFRNGAPTIGSQRNASLTIGGHREMKSVLDLQSSIGNQGTQEILSKQSEQVNAPSPPTAANSPGTTVSVGSGSSSLKKNYRDINDMEQWTDDLQDEDWSDDELDDDDEFDDDKSDESQDEQAPPEKRVSNEFLMERNKESKADKKVVRAGLIGGVDLDSTTFYANEEQRKKYGRGFAEGKMVNKTGGGSLNTIGSNRAPALGSKENRHVFVMDDKGRFHTNDAVKENRDRSKEIRNQRKKDLLGLKDQPKKQEQLRNMNLPEMERFHHSSFLAGEDVAGAGEMQVRDGQVELVSDASGHYKPGSKQMIQTVQQLEKNKAPIEQMGVEFVGKPEFEYEYDFKTGKDRIDPETGKKVIKRDHEGKQVAKKDRDGVQKTSKELQASAMELLGYANHAPEAAEERMRDMHARKDGVLQELLRKTKQVAPISYDYRGDVQDQHSSLMKELRSKVKKTEPIAQLPEEQYYGDNILAPEFGGKVSENEDEVDDYSEDYSDDDYNEFDEDGSGSNEIIDRGYGDIDSPLELSGKSGPDGYTTGGKEDNEVVSGGYTSFDRKNEDDEVVSGGYTSFDRKNEDDEVVSGGYTSFDWKNED